MPLRKTIFTLFFISGFCGLLYQVIWIRLAFSCFGIITPVLSVVISIFMMGLSLGSWAGGKWISKVSSSAVYWYAATEFLIGIGAFTVPNLLRFGETLLLPGGELNSTSYLFYSSVIIFLSILPWCFLMGATFPFMMAFIRERDEASEESFSFLYLANVMGAMCGTILTAAVLIELLGFQRTLDAAGSLNFLIAFISSSLGIRYRSSGRRTNKQIPASPTKKIISSNETIWIYLILFMTGFTSMSLEVVWVRNFTPVLGTTVYAFALIVTIYLLATWLGSHAYRQAANQGKIVAAPELVAALAVSSLLLIVINDPRLHHKMIRILVGIFPFCFLLGYLTPSLIDRYSQGDPDRAGRAYAVNIIGCILGPLLASYFFLPQFGAKGSMVLMSLPYVITFGVFFFQISNKWKFPTALTVIGLLSCALFTSRSYEELYDNCVIRRDATATVTSMGTGMNKRLLVNGIGITELTTVTKVMAHLPLLLLREQPTSALDICFGMGTTYRSLLRWGGLKATAVELVPSVKEAFGYYHDDAISVLQNPHGRIVIDDGRRFLRRTDEKFDVITIDPPPPIEAAGSSLLYAKEFYALIKKRLKPSGILQQWFPGETGPECRAITRSLVESFPYVRAYRSCKGSGYHFLASLQPIQMPTTEEAVSRLPTTARKDLLEWEPNINAQTFMKRLLAGQVDPSQLTEGAKGPIVSDDQPYNEYYLMRRAWARIRKRC